MSRTGLRLRTHRGRQVRGVGPLGAKVVLLAEALGKDEERGGEPLIGAAGQFLFEGRDAFTGKQTLWDGLESFGLPRSSLRLENVLETRPLDNSLLNVEPSTIRKAQADWWERASKLSGANVIVPMGNLALNTVRRAPLPVNPKTGKWRTKKVLGQKVIAWKDTIGNWRGSIFNITLNNGAKLKCMPTYHPAFVSRAGDFFDAWEGDWTRIRGDANFPELRRFPAAEHLIDPTESDVRDFYHLVDKAFRLRGLDACLAGDIETVKRSFIDLVGFSLNSNFSITINTREPWAWRWIAKLLAHPIPKGWHYGIFDCYVLRRLKGMAIQRPLYFDSQLQHHCLDPRDTHRLAYCASRDLRVRFWKHERDKEDEASLATKNPKKRKRYNGKDVAYTRALIEVYKAKLESANLLDVYRLHYRRLGEACLRMSLTGFRVDETARREIFRRETANLAAIKSRILERAGDLWGPKGGFAAPRVCAYFYDTLKCRPFIKRGTSARTADELSIRRLMRKYKKARPVGTDILAYRKHAKIKQEVRGAVVDSDQRMRSRFLPLAKTGRLRSGKHALGSGVNLQNRDRHSDLRRMFVADRGHVLVELDESQAEDRIVDGMSGDKKLLAMIGSIAVDRHVLNAERIYDDVDYDSLLAAYKAGDSEANEKRQMGKRVRHAVNYGMQGARMAEVALVESEGTLVLDPDECQEWISRMLAAMPGIVDYHDWIIQDMLDNRALTDSWGWTIHFKGLRISKEDYKEGFAWRASNEVAKLMNQRAFVLADRKIQRGDWQGVKTVQQGHDSLCLSVPVDRAWEVASTLYASLNTEHTYPGAGGEWSLKMPIGVKVGHNWREMQEWKVLPTEKEFTKVMSTFVA